MANGVIRKDARQWIRVLEKNQAANTAIDDTISVSYPGEFTEIMYTIQRYSNGRTIASTVVPLTQFQGGAMYAMGAYTLYTGTMKDSTIVVVNGVAIQDTGTIEIACNACPESLKHRIFVR